MDLNSILYLLTIAGTVVGTIGTLTWWLSSQFRVTRDLIYTQVQQVLAKLEYHEKHDDSRFLDMRNDIWEIRLRNAAIDGKRIHRRIEKETSEND